jgi:xanthine dehydrogenase small subunit
MPRSIEFVLNGRPVRIDNPPPHRTLLDELRARGLTGAKEGCAEGECGACTVVVVCESGRLKAAPTRSEYRAINSCLMLVPMAAGHELYTVEALAENGVLAGAQQAMAEAGGSQCGYCTPGFVMSLFAEHYRPDRTGPCDPLALGGNLCRCTGYRPIRDAATSLGSAPDDRFRARLDAPAPALGAVDIDGFSRPRSIPECIAALAANPAATLIAGGTDLGVDVNLKAKRWPHIVSVEAIAELHAVNESPSGVRIGAAVPLTDIGRRWPARPAAVDEWLALFASPPIRNRATLGGNLATASPIGDGAPLLLALDASVDIAGAGGRRTVPLASFFTGYRKTALAPGELIVGIGIPAPLPDMLRFYKIAKRGLDDISTVAAAMAVDVDERGRVTRARFAFGGVAATPVRVTAAEDAIAGLVWDDAAAASARDIIGRTLTPMSDHRGSTEYRRQVAASLVDKFLWETTGPDAAGPEGPALRGRTA